ncbi:hypothetical protein EVAR_16598_1 [Eumeta japonica]|uniref:Uncharacterized protein n=1 Tax=Eumeta variegata TaxID=151549 RepID=A0A4C1V184_EUMVA|nr:hypothetical protein EVAR_16598_1 [Eumeta japonica]
MLALDGGRPDREKHFSGAVAVTAVNIPFSALASVFVRLERLSGRGSAVKGVAFESGGTAFDLEQERMDRWTEIKASVSDVVTPKGCRQPYRTRPIDIVMLSASDCPTEDTLGYPRRRESEEVSKRVGTSGSHWYVVGTQGDKQLEVDRFRGVLLFL